MRHINTVAASLFHVASKASHLYVDERETEIASAAASLSLYTLILFEYSNLCLTMASMALYAILLDDDASLKLGAGIVIRRRYAFEIISEHRC